MFSLQFCMKTPQGYCICASCDSPGFHMLIQKEKEVFLLVVDDLINDHPFRSASPMIHVNLEGIRTCLIISCLEIVGVH